MVINKWVIGNAFIPVATKSGKMGQNSLHSPAAPFVTGSLLLINRIPFTTCILSMDHLEILDTESFLDGIWWPKPLHRQLKNEELPLQQQLLWDSKS